VKKKERKGIPKSIEMMCRRQRLLWWNRKARHEIRPCRDRTSQIGPASILGFMTLRNEMSRLPHFFDHHRKLGVDHFLVVENNSDDGSREWLENQPDVSLWTTDASYKASRFGMNWLGWLHMRYGHGHWCLTLDADEIFVYPDHQKADLRVLTGWLGSRGIRMMGAMMLDLYPRGPLSTAVLSPGKTPLDVLDWFDAEGYSREYKPRYRLISLRGGPRKRMFFADEPELAPHLHKTPLIFWKRRFSYASSTHHALPAFLNAGFFENHPAPTGLLLHTKFLSEVIDKSAEETTRKQHFTHSENYLEYYEQVMADPVLWYEGSVPLRPDTDFVALGLMRRNEWNGTDDPEPSGSAAGRA
jgi:hypothetical protein